MTSKEILTELLAIKLYENDYNPNERRSRSDQHPWNFIADEDHQIYRDIIMGAATPRALCGEDGEGLA